MRTFLKAEWRHLVMLNYEVAPSALLPLRPPGTELDFHDGRTFASVVGFLFLDTRVLGLPVPLHRNFEEVNLRFYVRRGPRRGVAFVREIVPRPAITAVARILYNENYVTAPMSHRIDAGRSVEYGWRRSGRRYRLAARLRPGPRPMAPGSQEEFIAEHYWGYARSRSGGLVEYEVRHPRWRVWDVADSRLEGDLHRLYGPTLGPFLDGPPASAFVAEGSVVTVGRGTCYRDASANTGNRSNIETASTS